MELTAIATNGAPSRGLQTACRHHALTPSVRFSAGAGIRVEPDEAAAEVLRAINISGLSRDTIIQAKRGVRLHPESRKGDEETVTVSRIQAPRVVCRVEDGLEH